MSGLRESDLLLKINSVNVANEQYAKIISMIRELKESKGIIKLEVFRIFLFYICLISSFREFSI